MSPATAAWIEGGMRGWPPPESAAEQAARLRYYRPLPHRYADALADGTPIDRADGTIRDLSESEALAAWRAGVALVVRS